MTDLELLQQFQNGTLPKEDFRHRNHLRLALIYLQQVGLEQATITFPADLLRYATQLGATAIFNVTLTQFWLLLVNKALNTQTTTIDLLLKQHPELMDKNLPYHYYSPERLDSPKAHQTWLEPDLKPLP